MKNLEFGIKELEISMHELKIFYFTSNLMIPDSRLRNSKLL